ncbi:FadR/GntR family transcriptional regulator [Candidatus Neomarinimicrobiota bacterium]
MSTTSDTEPLFSLIGGSVTLSQELVDQIEALIKARKLRPGDKLPTENELGRQFGVSRTVVREALQNLSAKDLIVVKKGTGAFVKDFSSSQAIEHMSLFLELTLDEELVAYLASTRKLIEPELAALAAVNRTAADIAELKTSLEAFDQCDEDDHELEGELDRNFHHKIALATHNPVLAMIIDPILQILPIIQRMTFHAVDSARDRTIEYHNLLLENIIAGDAEKSRWAMEEHLKIAERHARYILENKQ